MTMEEIQIWTAIRPKSGTY